MENLYLCPLCSVHKWWPCASPNRNIRIWLTHTHNTHTPNSTDNLVLFLSLRIRRTVIWSVHIICHVKCITTIIVIHRIMKSHQTIYKINIRYPHRRFHISKQHFHHPRFVHAKWQIPLTYTQVVFSPFCQGFHYQKSVQDNLDEIHSVQLAIKYSELWS